MHVNKLEDSIKHAFPRKSVPKRWQPASWKLSEVVRDLHARWYGGLASIHLTRLKSLPKLVILDLPLDCMYYPQYYLSRTSILEFGLSLFDPDKTKIWVW